MNVFTIKVYGFSEVLKLRTIAMRFSDNSAPVSGTIAAHEELIKKNGYVWWGKFGSGLNAKVINELNMQENAMILLISSGKPDRYWAHISEVSKSKPPFGESPLYYWEIADNIKTWFKITFFEKAPKTVMSKCRVASSQKILAMASKHSMSPYFIIDYNG